MAPDGDDKTKKKNRSEKLVKHDRVAANPILLGFMTGVAYVVAVLTWPFRLCKAFEKCKMFGIKILHCHPYERAVVLRLGRKLPGELKGPGRVIVFPWIDDYWIIDQRSIVVDVPPQEVLTKDAVTVAMGAVLVYKILDPMRAIMQVEDPIKSTSLIAVTALRNEMSKRDFAQVLTEREAMMTSMKIALDEVTKPWGIEVQRVDIKNVSLPPALQKVMVAEADAERETKARIIASEAEATTAKALIEASAPLVANPTALQLRYLQMLNAITTNKESTLVFPFPMDFLETFQSQPGPSSRVK